MVPWSRGNADCGNDVLIGGTGDDQLYGDEDPSFSVLTNVTRGADRFVFANGSGLDTVFDFENGRDLIDLRLSRASTASPTCRPTTSRQIGADTVIDLGAAAGGPPA